MLTARAVGRELPQPWRDRRDSGGLSGDCRHPEKELEGRQLWGEGGRGEEVSEAGRSDYIFICFRENVTDFPALP